MPTNKKTLPPRPTFTHVLGDVFEQTGVDPVTGKPIWTNMGRPPLPSAQGTPNPLANVNPNPAGNRNTAIPKTGAVLPFPNPNQQLLDALGGRNPLGIPNVQPVGGVAAGDLAKTTGPAGEPVSKAPAAGPAPLSDAERKKMEEELAGLQRQLTALGFAEEDPDYQAAAGDVVRRRAMTDRITALFSALQAGVAVPTTPKVLPTKLEKAVSWLTDAFQLLLNPGQALADAWEKGQFNKLSVKELQDQLYALRDKTGADADNMRTQIQNRLGQLQPGVDATTKDAIIGKMYFQGAVGNKDSASVFEGRIPQNFIDAFNDNRLDPSHFSEAKRLWEASHPGQVFPAPGAGDKSSNYAKFYKQQQELTKPGGVPPAPVISPTGAEDYTAYILNLNALLQMVPDSSDIAGIQAWSKAVIQAPPGIHPDPQGQWVRDDDSLAALTPEQRTAANWYEAALASMQRFDAIASRYVEADAKASQTRQEAADADARLQRALKDDDITTAAELAYRKTQLDMKLAQDTQNLALSEFMYTLAKDPATLYRMQAGGQLAKIEALLGITFKIPPKATEQQVLALLPPPAEMARMDQATLQAKLYEISGLTGWGPEELGRLLGTIAGAPGGAVGGVTESTVRRS